MLSPSKCIHEVRPKDMRSRAISLGEAALQWCAHELTMYLHTESDLILSGVNSIITYYCIFRGTHTYRSDLIVGHFAMFKHPRAMSRWA
jgi:hypothetical protein